MGWATDADRSPATRRSCLPQVLPPIIRAVAIDVPDLTCGMPAFDPKDGQPIGEEIFAADPDAPIAIAIDLARDIPNPDAAGGPSLPCEQARLGRVIEEGAQSLGGERLTHGAETARPCVFARRPQGA
jgi:hypothetical protein